MTRWGALLLVAFVAFGLANRLPTSVAMRSAGLLTAAVLVAVWFIAW